jgi:hypothetical protein
MSKLKSGYSGALWAMERQFRDLNASVSAQIKALRGEVAKELGFASRLNAVTLGPLLLWTTRREERQLAKGKTYEPPTFLERTNWVTV